ncbi:MAG TPA: SNF2-related protein [Blastocatellia bacterium]
MNWKLPEPIKDVSFTVEPDGVWLRAAWGEITDWPQLRSRPARNRLGRVMPAVIAQLLELGLASLENGALKIPHDQFARLEENGIDAFEDVAPWAPFTLELNSSGALGLPDFRYRYRFYLGRQVVYPERLGGFVRRGEDDVYRLDGQTLALIEAVERFNALPPEKKEAQAYLKFAEIKGLAEGTGAGLDSYLHAQRVLVPSRFALDIVTDEQGRVSFAPRVDGLADDAMWQAFATRGAVDEVYSINQDGQQVYVVLDEAQRETLRRMQKARWLGGAEKAEALRNPQAVFDGVAETIDLSDFGPRVHGIGDFPFVAQPYYSAGTGIFDGVDREPRDGHADFSAGIQFRYADGSTEDIKFETPQEIFDLQREVQEAHRNGKGVVEFKGKSILLETEFRQALDELAEKVGGPKAKKDEKQRCYLLVYTNEVDREYEEGAEATEETVSLQLPCSLKPEVMLKDHQKEGVRWLQQNYLLGEKGRRGCLLADDMGLGKTLQVLTFLAWLIERGEIAGGADPEAAPWHPILIVAPVILIENETWLQDMRQFFAADGAIFTPHLVLRGKKLEEFRTTRGKEVEVGQAVLDLDRICRHRVVLTNYETIVNYQHSFARMRDRWSVVITDEAQEYKTANTKISHALKSLSPRFRVAATGTPVETKLSDVWNLFDFLQPGPLLGSLTEFRRNYENRLSEPNGGALPELKKRLRFNRADAYLLRRDKKTSLLELPKKYEHKLPCELSAEQRQMHLELLGSVGRGGKNGHPLKVIPQLQRLYQHPALIPRYEPMSADAAMRSCPKLAAVIECLKSIRAKSEKVLIFTRSLDAQHLLISVLNEVFRLEVEVVNGSTSRNSDAQGADRTRKAIVNRFRESAGFNVLILSPDVAGIGLTIVEANHVIHYGRWWNPAKESQATDRVYRIGQQRDVHVYHPIARDPRGEFETFDEKLDQLIERRLRLAADFLSPMPDENQLGQELFGSLLNQTERQAPQPASPPLSKEDVKRLSDSHFAALVAALEQSNGRQVFLTPKHGNGGIDVVSIQGTSIRLIQCRRFQPGQAGVEIAEDAIAELLSAGDLYSARISLLRVGMFTLGLALATNGQPTKAAHREAKEQGVELMTENSLMKNLQLASPTRLAIEAQLQSRCRSMNELLVEISAVTGKF